MYKNNSNSAFIGGLLTIVGAILCLLLVGYIAQRLDDSYFTGGINNYQNTTTSTTNTDSVDNTEPEVEAVCGIIVENPSENETTYSPLSITGYVKGCGWDPVDGEIGTVALFDGTTGQMLSGEVDISVLTTTASGNTNFSAILSYPDTTSSLSGFLYFKHTSMGETFSLPIKY